MLDKVKAVARHSNGKVNHYIVSNAESVGAARAFVREQVPTAKVILALVPKQTGVRGVEAA